MKEKYNVFLLEHDRRRATLLNMVQRQLFRTPSKQQNSMPGSTNDQILRVSTTSTSERSALLTLNSIAARPETELSQPL